SLLPCQTDQRIDLTLKLDRFPQFHPCSFWGGQTSARYTLGYVPPSSSWLIRSTSHVVVLIFSLSIRSRRSSQVCFKFGVASSSSTFFSALSPSVCQDRR